METVLNSILFTSLALAGFIHCLAGQAKHDHGKEATSLAYYKNGQAKAFVVYHTNGKIIRADCYDSNGNRQLCNQRKHGTPNPLAVYKSDGITKDYVYAYYRNGNTKTAVFYTPAGKKTIEVSHHNNGAAKTFTVYRADGGTKKVETTYYRNRKLKSQTCCRADGSSYTPPRLDACPE